ncbi:2-deoxy-5-keto-D-gluconate 6-phosphate aldolase domain-containing protein [Pseudactinotalea terrae]|uniref:2-deoxy-5-keto-D-gluconate 6-phosphate aldolase domain-containing protein n=1 Tax=Pseudactinotalea terrae TaxID=1743262 RepID=UPI001391A876|nr:DUF2090 domain-containing protein [Pseudactinotalea terrae]
MTARPLAFLAFDHRERAFGSVRPGGMNHEQIQDSKRLIYEAFGRAVDLGLGDVRPGILVDEQFGAGIAQRAIADGVLVAMPVERANEQVFTFEYGADYQEHLLQFRPSCAKVLIQHRTTDPADDKLTQLTRLRELSEFLAAQSIDFMCELIVGMGEESLDGVPSVDVDALCASMAEIQAAGVLVTMWKVEGVASREGAERIAAQAAASDHPATCMVLGAGAAPSTVEHWLAVAAGTPGYIGFAVGRSFWGEAVSAWLDGRLSREDAIESIASIYRACTLRYMGADVR